MRTDRKELLRTLAKLERREGPCSVEPDHLARALGVTPNAARGMLRRLEKEGVVCTRPDPMASRAKLAGLSEAGRGEIDGA